MPNQQTQHKWNSQDDANILVQAQAIQQDSKRYAAATEALQGMMDGVQKNMAADKLGKMLKAVIKDD